LEFGRRIVGVEAAGDCMGIGELNVNVIVTGILAILIFAIVTRFLSALAMALWRSHKA
jgi:hypothetical protein